MHRSCTVSALASVHYTQKGQFLVVLSETFLSSKVNGMQGKKDWALLLRIFSPFFEQQL
jgi:hypothetical protein